VKNELGCGGEMKCRWFQKNTRLFVLGCYEGLDFNRELL
jgi:hypothetical protein